MTERWRVIERNGWSYVIADEGRQHEGPWRYRWEAQERADELNSRGGNDGASGQVGKTDAAS